MVILVEKWRFFEHVLQGCTIAPPILLLTQYSQYSIQYSRINYILLNIEIIERLLREY